ncbi:phosphatase 2C-like domain-containing protein [Dioszegia hungarica]|uniref:Phosphatase 2C-like domain-containing protein n=1 Tax=Dioszegia hungarica TaxID=4972 RepID=A0AA38LW54_9TREE|nr:phosphatase 2C-like domain-containing protein [Dioszegia hungarica]KAI9637243.1 phosphatase 2C-like domain-containing protein [Dioszegia hungarica]
MSSNKRTADLEISVAPIETPTCEAMRAALVIHPGPGVTCTSTSPGESARGGTYALLNEETTEALLHQHESARSAPGIKCFSSQLPVNTPNEDRCSTHLLSEADLAGLVESAIRGPGGFWRAWDELVDGKKADDELRSSWVMSSVIDGLARGEVADTINRVLHASLAFALGCQENRDDGSIKSIITKVYEQIDQAIISAPQNFLNPNPCTPASTLLPPGCTALLGAAGLLYPSSGAVAATVLLDLTRQRVYVASLGDCRVLLGWKDEHGKWGTKDTGVGHTVKNEKEIELLMKRHQNESRDQLISPINGFIKGMASHTRCFGKPDSKVPPLHDDRNEPYFFHDRSMRALGILLPKIPTQQDLPGAPYILSTPEVACTVLEKKGAKLKFIVLATDGVTDRLSSKEIVHLVAGQLERSAPVSPLTDDNPATGLIRAAIGGGDPRTRQILLSLGAPMGRAMRDDMTVT